MKNISKIFIVLLLLIIIFAATFYLLKQKKPTIDLPAVNDQANTQNKLSEVVHVYAPRNLEDVVLFVDKDKYGPNEELSVNVSLRNPFSETKKWIVIYYFSSKESGGISAIGQQETIVLDRGKSGRSQFATYISDNLPSGYYEIKIEILEDEQQIAQRTKIVEISKTKQVINANMRICADANCEQEKTVFLTNEDIYIEIETNIDDFSSKFILIHDNNETEYKMKNNIVLLKLDQADSYKVSIWLGKEGYQELFLGKSFAVISEQVIIQNTSKCELDGICSNMETPKNCPQDCIFATGNN